MYEEFTQNRIAQLHAQTGVPDKHSSELLGLNPGYINKIVNKRSLPSLSALFSICRHFDITPKDFFDDGIAYPTQLHSLISDLKKLDEKDLELITAVVKKLLNE